MIDLKTVPVRSDAYCQRQLGEETIFLSPAGDEIHSLDAVGTFLWQQFDGTNDLQRVLDRLCEEYDVDPERARRDLIEFVRELVERKLLIVED